MFMCTGGSFSGFQILIILNFQSIPMTELPMITEAFQICFNTWQQILFLIFLFQKCIGSSCLLLLPVEPYFPLSASHSLWDVSSLIRNWTHALSKWKHGILTTGLPGTFRLNFKTTLSHSSKMRWTWKPMIQNPQGKAWCPAVRTM